MNVVLLPKTAFDHPTAQGLGGTGESPVPPRNCTTCALAPGPIPTILTGSF